MKYQLTPIEEEGINAGNIITMACYNAKHAAMAELITKHLNITYKIEQSESPTGKNIYLFFLYPDTYWKAFRAGDMANVPELYQDELKHIIPTWENVFIMMNKPGHA
jgi:hypothetical protein